MCEENIYYVSCGKCKLVEDTFTIGEETPEEFDWVRHRGKWYCPSCANDITKNADNCKTNKNKQS